MCHFGRNDGTLWHNKTHIVTKMSSNIKVQKVCQSCGSIFTARTTVTKYCSDRCAKRAYKARIRSERIDKSNKDTEAYLNLAHAELKEKAFLSITETTKLIGISRRTIYRMISKKELFAAKLGKRTIIRRTDIDRIFDLQLAVDTPEPETNVTLSYDTSECYKFKEVMEKYNVSEKALYDIILRKRITRIKQGIYSYLPKVEIDKLFNPMQ